MTHTSEQATATASVSNQVSLSGWWRIKFDEDNQGIDLGWPGAPPEDCQDINLPSAWNEVFPERYTYQGTAWYFREIRLQPGQPDERVTICFEGANYRCEVYVNGRKVGEHEGGFTCFTFDITDAIQPGELNLFAVRVNGDLDEWTLPPSGVDWFNYCGIYRPVYLRITRSASIDDITIKTRLDGNVSLAASIAAHRGGSPYRLRAVISDQSGLVVAAQEAALALQTGSAFTAKFDLTIANPHLWKLRAAYLYTLDLRLVDADGAVCDGLQKRFGVREISIAGQEIRLNGDAVQLVGCSKHDEYPMTGRAVTREQLIKDYDLLRQMNANFVRLAHYPHSRLEHDILDELGMLAISEIPMVFLGEAQMTSPETLAKSQHMLAEMISAEKNATCIMFWSLFIECETNLPSTRPFVQAMVERARELDETRLIVMASNRPLTDVTYDYFDVIGVNYWRGWYEGESIPDGQTFLAQMAERYPDKPMLITSHGWEGLYGVRSYEPQIPWSEDAQASYLSQIADVMMRYKNIVGEIVWTFADFRVSSWKDISNPARTPNYLERPEMVNQKGMVDYFRRPKSTYYVMKEKFSEWQQGSAPAIGTYGENLRAHVYSTRRLAGNAAAFDFIDTVNGLLDRKDTVSVILATAASQFQFYEALLVNRMFVAWDRLNVFHLDEYVGISRDHRSGFARVLKDRLIDLLPVRQFHALDCAATDLEAECQRYAALLAANAIDLACIGIGENGHIAFNDPPVADFNDSRMVKVVDLDDACREQQFRERAFPTLDSVPRQAFTLTIPAILRANKIQCLVPGAVKEIAVWKTLSTEISPKCPATILRRHRDVKLYLDRESAALL